MFVKRVKRSAFFVFLSAGLHCLETTPANALPWDIDMFRQQSLKANEIARAPVEGTVPLGYRPFTISIEEAEKSWKNPVRPRFQSVWAGRRLYNANCWTCHGKTGDGKGPVGSQLGAPNLLQAPYLKRSDGRIYAVIHHGLRNMPRYGFKFSEREKWDLVNYIKFLQGETRVRGIPKPKSE